MVDLQVGLKGLTLVSLKMQVSFYRKLNENGGCGILFNSLCERRNYESPDSNEIDLYEGVIASNDEQSTLKVRRTDSIFEHGAPTRAEDEQAPMQARASRTPLQHAPVCLYLTHARTYAQCVTRWIPARVFECLRLCSYVLQYSSCESIDVRDIDQNPELSDRNVSR